MPHFLHELDFLNDTPLQLFSQRPYVNDRPGDKLAFMCVESLKDDLETTLTNDLFEWRKRERGGGGLAGELGKERERERGRERGRDNARKSRRTREAAPSESRYEGDALATNHTHARIEPKGN